MKNRAIAYLVFVSLLWMSNLLLAQNISNCDRELVKVKEAYHIGKFEQCINQVELCIDKNGYTKQSKIVALSFLAKAYLAIDSIELGQEVIREILLRKDNYEAEIDDPLRFKRNVELVRSSLKSNTIMSVSKKAEKLELAPATIVVITAEDILNRGYKTLDEVMDDLPGVDIAATNGLVGKSINLRGYRSENMNDKTMIVFDGVEDNEMFTQFAYVGKQIPIQSIKRVELIYGPASSLYGANAFSGVINVVTKDGSDLFKKKKKSFNQHSRTEYTLEGRVNTGSFNTQSLEMDGGVKLKNGIVIQTFGRYFVSDENNLSAYKDWDGKWTEEDFGENHYFNTLSDSITEENRNFWDSLIQKRDPTGEFHSFNADSTKILPTNKAIKEITALDQSVYNQIPTISGFQKYRGADPKQFTDKTTDQYFGVKVTLGDLILQAQIVDRNEGASPDYVDKYFAVNSLYTNWHTRQQFISSRYSKKLSDNWFFYNTAYFRVSDFGTDSRLTEFKGFAQNKLELDDFLAGERPKWNRRSYYQQCKQFRDEFRLQYIIDDRNDLLLGAEIRNGVFQSNYLTTDSSDNAISNGSIKSELGGNKPAMFDIGAFFNYTYSNPEKHINLAAGGRWDQNVVAESQQDGYSRFNPRLSAVFYPDNWVFKAIYSEAIFAFPSFTKFSSSATRIRPVNLTPEKVRNAEFSVHRTLLHSKLNLEGVVYHTRYSNSLITNKINELTQWSNRENAETHVTGGQFIGKWNINQDIHLNLNGSFNNSWLHLQGVDGSDSSLRTAQIADFTLFFGIGISFLKKKGYVYFSTNLVGNKYTGKGTSLENSELLETIPGYQLVNLSLRYEILPSIHLQLIGRNLLNEFYVAPGIRSAAGSYSSLIPQPGRNINVAMNFKF